MHRRLAVAALWSLVSPATAPAQKPRPPEGYIVTTDSARLYYRVLGHTPDTILVVHGGPGGDMTGLIPDFGPLIARHTVIFYDQRGGGRSELPADTTRLFAKRQIADVDDVRRFFGIDRVTVLGHSYGPLLVGSYAVAHPQHVRRMILIGGLPPWRGDVWKRISTAMAARLDSSQQQRAAEIWKRMADSTADIHALCRAYWQIMLRPRFAEPDRFLAKGTGVDLCVPTNRALWYGYNVAGRVVMPSYGDWDLRPALRTLDIPLLVIHGEQEAIPMDMSMEWASSVRGAALLKVPNAAHFPYLEKPDIVWPAIERFLGRGVATDASNPAAARAARAALDEYLINFWIKRDTTALARALSPELIYHYNGRDIPGAPENHYRALHSFGDAYTGLTARIEAFTFAGDLGAAVTRISGTHIGPTCGQPGSGKTITWSVNYVFRVANARIVELWETWDEGGFYRALGIDQSKCK